MTATSKPATSKPADHPAQTIPPVNSPYGTDDPRTHLLAALDAGRVVMAMIQPDQLDQATPCAEFTVSDLGAHLLGVLERIVVVGQNSSESVWPELVPDYYKVDSYMRDWDRLTEEIRTTWADDSLLKALLVLPFAEMPGVAALGLYTAEILIHAWDLAAGVELSVDWNQDLAAGALIGMQFGLPADIRDDPEVPFDAVVPTADDASAMDRLVAWVGRDPLK